MLPALKVSTWIRCRDRKKLDPAAAAAAPACLLVRDAPLQCLPVLEPAYYELKPL